MNTKQNPNEGEQSQLDALRKLAAGRTPDATTKLDLRKRLRPFYGAIRDLKKRYRLESIAEMLSDPSVGLPISPSTLGRYLAKRRVPRAKA